MFFAAAITAWWNAWIGFWEELRLTLDPEEQRIARSQSFDHLDADQMGYGGGSFDGAGTGGQD